MRPPVRPPRLRCALFPLIYPPHLLVLPATFGLHLFLQTYPYFRALYVISVRRTKGLPTASFRFRLTSDTLAVQLYTSLLPRRVRDFHPLERAHGAQTEKAMQPYWTAPLLFHNTLEHGIRSILRLIAVLLILGVCLRLFLHRFPGLNFLHIPCG